MTEAFHTLALIPPLLRALAEEGYPAPTPIQLAAIPAVLAGRDLLATAQTGTGKTAAYALPMLQLLHGRPAGRAGALRALILAPTRELALQIDTSLRTYGRHLPLRAAVLLGGVPAGPQIRALAARPDILTATPGRLLDLVRQGHVHLGQVEMLVLDEGDRMLDMGFAPDVRRIVALTPAARQTLLCSATIPPEITELAAGMLRDPVRVVVTPSASVPSTVEQKVLFVQQGDKRDLLARILGDESVERALVFTRTRRRADRVTRHLVSQGIAADAIHSDKAQGARQRALAAFDRGAIRVLVATDIAARGLDVEGISHVINYELPNDPEAYVHRIGRTARAGASGTALSLCDAEEFPMLQGIEKLTQCRLTVVQGDGYGLLAEGDTATQGEESSTDRARARPARNGAGSRRPSAPGAAASPRSSAASGAGRRPGAGPARFAAQPLRVARPPTAEAPVALVAPPEATPATWGRRPAPARRRLPR
ncbi:MAG: DEAD/DEAH box helicase [Candidatus Latescibacterota bacterium]